MRPYFQKKYRAYFINPPVHAIIPLYRRKDLFSLRYRYDHRDKKIFRIIGITFTVMFIIALLIVSLSDKAADISFPGIVAVLGGVFFPIPALAGWYAYLDCIMYIKKLKTGGVEVPEDKRLKPMLDAPPVYPPEVTRNRESLALAGICFVMAGCMLVHLLFFYLKWDPRIGDECTFMAFLQLIPALLWAIAGGIFLHQSSPKRYRDDVVFDPGRKERVRFTKGILLILIMFAITFAAYRAATSITDYVYHTRLRDKFGGDYREHIGEPAMLKEIY